MAQDPGSQNTQAQEIDLDDLEVNILILGKNASSLNQAAAFLTRRGWPTTVLTNVSKAVEHIAEAKPDFVLVSFSHPSQAVIKLPELITQTFNLTCVGFVENMDPASQNKLSGIKLRYKVQGMPSGPNLHRSIRKILAERFDIQDESHQADPAARERGKGNENNLVTVRGGAQPEGAGDGGTLLQSAPGGFDPDWPSGSEYKRSRKIRRSLKELAATAGHGASANSSAEGAQLAKMLKDSLFGEGGGDSGDFEKYAAAAETAARQVVNSANELPAQATATDAYYANARNKASSSSAPSYHRTAHSSAASSEVSPLLTELTPEQAEALPAPKLLERAVTAAMHRICQSYADTITRELGKLTKVAVFPIDSAALAGYLVLGLEQNPNKIEEFFLKSCETVLREEFSAMNVPARLENGFWVHVPEVRFHSWVDEKGDFKVVLPHEEGEVGIGFFPVPQLPKPRPNGDNKEMLKVSLDDISTDQPVNFKAYIHLKKNQKYFLYLRNGRQLQPEQKKRLKGRKVEDIYMKSVEAENLRMFMAASFLRDKIKKGA